MIQQKEERDSIKAIHITGQNMGQWQKTKGKLIDKRQKNRLCFFPYFMPMDWVTSPLL